MTGNNVSCKLEHQSMPLIGALFRCASKANEAERTNMRSRAYAQYFGGLVAGIGLGFLICRACQAKGWLDVGNSPLFIVGGGIMIAVGVALAQVRPKQTPSP